MSIIARLLVALGILVLVLGPASPLTPVAAAAAANDAGLASQSAYPTINPGESVGIFMTVRNTGTATWTPTSGHGYRATDRWAATWAQKPVWRTVRPNETLTFEERVTPPSVPGTYRYGFLMTYRGAAFGPYFFIDVTVRQPNVGIPTEKRLDVPYRSQMVTTRVLVAERWPTPVEFSPPVRKLTGVNNCGPAAVTMAILFHNRSSSVTVNDAALALRGSNSDVVLRSRNGAERAVNGFTSFKTLASGHGTFYSDRGVRLEDVTGYDDLRRQLAKDRPVLVLVSSNSAWAGKSGVISSADHIVVVTGYNATTVFVNDPLSTGTAKDVAVPVETFKQVAAARGWYASAVARQ